MLFMSALSGLARAQTPFPAPLPGTQTPAPLVTLPSPPVGQASPFGATGPIGGLAAPKPSDEASEACRKEFLPLRSEAERRGQLVRAAGDRHAPASEACKLMGDFRAAEVKMMKYVEANSASCGIPSNVLSQLKTGHESTERMLAKVCAAVDAKEPKGPQTDF